MSEPGPESAAGGNLHEFTVSELAGALQRTVEDRFGRVRLRGEVSGFKRAASGHLYLDLKDANAVIAAVCWRSAAGRLRVQPEDGAEVIVTGRLTTYAARSQYQIIVESLELAGEGALLKMLEDRRKALAKEGLFDADCKQPLPHLPEVIGIVTSPTGAVLRDILHRLRDRFPRYVLVWPVPVQGTEAAGAIAAAIAGFNALDPDGPVPRPDVLLVARGGGSVEDLWAFNEEIVVRAAAASAIPLISAVGHETDTTLIDFAADVRAPTPTAAAELSVPVRAELAADTASLGARLGVAMDRGLVRRRELVRGLARGLRGPRALADRGAQRLDHAVEGLRRARAASLQACRHALDLAAGRLVPRLLAATVFDHSRRVGDAGARLARETRDGLTERRRRLQGLATLLESVSHKRVLARGYAVLRDGDARPLTATAAIRPGMALDIELKDGHVAATAAGREQPPRRKRGGGPPEQGSLL